MHVSKARFAEEGIFSALEILLKKIGIRKKVSDRACPVLLNVGLLCQKDQVNIFKIKKGLDNNKKKD